MSKGRAGGRWTEGRYWSFVRSALRRAAMKWPVKQDVLHAARRSKKKGTPGRHRFEYQCNECTKWFKGSEVQVDHIIPAGSLTCPEHLPEFVERLFCEEDGLQVLCKKCHHIKTQEERKRD